MTTIAIHLFCSSCSLSSSSSRLFTVQPHSRPVQSASMNKWDIIFYLCGFICCGAGVGAHLAYENRLQKATAVESECGDYYYWNLIHILNFRFPFVDASVGRLVGAGNLWYYIWCRQEKIIGLYSIYDTAFLNSLPFPNATVPSSDRRRMIIVFACLSMQHRLIGRVQSARLFPWYARQYIIWIWMVPMGNVIMCVCFID